MNDQRVAAFRKALNSLVESLDATVRVARWPAPEAIPAPLENSAAQLLDRLGCANRFAADRYHGAPPVVLCMTAMSAATRVLDAAYLEYRRHLAGFERGAGPSSDGARPRDRRGEGHLRSVGLRRA